MLKAALQGKDPEDETNRKRGYIEVFDQWLQDYEKQIGLTTSVRTYDKYMAVRKRLQQYIKRVTGKEDINLDEVTPMFVNNLETFLRTEYGIANNHAMKQMQKCRTIYQVAVHNGWAKSFGFRKKK